MIKMNNQQKKKIEKKNETYSNYTFIKRLY